MSKIPFSEKTYDVVIIGGGGSGLRASLEIAKSGLDVAVISQVFLQDRILLLHKEG